MMSKSNFIINVIASANQARKKMKTVPICFFNFFRYTVKFISR